MSNMLFPPLQEMEVHNQMKAYGLILAIMEMGWQVDISYRVTHLVRTPEVTVRAEHRQVQKRYSATSKGVTLAHALFGALSNIYPLLQQEQPKPDYTMIRWPDMDR